MCDDVLVDLLGQGIADKVTEAVDLTLIARMGRVNGSAGRSARSTSSSRPLLH